MNKNRFRKSKKGLIFMLDVFVSIIVISIFFLFFASFSSSDEPHSLSQQMVTNSVSHALQSSSLMRDALIADDQTELDLFLSGGLIMPYCGNILISQPDLTPVFNVTRPDCVVEPQSSSKSRSTLVVDGNIYIMEVFVWAAE